MHQPTTQGPLRPATLRWAGILAMASALLSLPLFLVSLHFEGRHDDVARTVELSLQVVGTGIFVVLTILLRAFLVRTCRFRKADAIITVLIILNLIYAGAASMGLLVPRLEEHLPAILTPLVILLGSAQAGLGWRLLGLEHGLGGLKRPYCWLNIVTGICLASLLLIPVGIVVSAVGDVMLGTIFLQEARRLSSLPGTDIHA